MTTVDDRATNDPTDTDLVCIGFTVLDILARHVDHLPGPDETALVEEVRLTAAGTAAGTSVIASRLGLRTRLIGSIGDDRLGDVVRDALASEGVDTSALQVRPGAPTSTSVLPITPEGGRPALFAPGASFQLHLDPPFSAALGTPFLHYGGVGLHPDLDSGPGADLLARAKELGTTVTCDVIAASVHTMPALAPVLPFVDYFMPTAREAMDMTETGTPVEAAQVLLDLGAGACVFKDGSRGSLLVRGNDVTRIPAFDVDVVDTTGCGDSYCAGFIAALSRGLDVERACRVGAGTAALVATGLGSDAGVRDYDALTAAIEGFTEKQIDQEQE